MTQDASGGWIRIPADLRPNAIPKARFEEFPNLQVRENGDGSWSIKTVESYRNLLKPGIRLTLIARGLQFNRAGTERLNHLTPLAQSTPRETLDAMAFLRQRQADLREDPEPMWSRFAGEVTLAVDSELESKLNELQSVGDATDSLWLAEVDPVLSRRFAFMRALFAQKYTKDALNPIDFGGFPAARELMMNSSSSFPVFFLPFLLLNAPWVGGYMAMRPNAAIIRLLTNTVAGRTASWTDQLDSFVPLYAGSAQPFGLGIRGEDLGTRESLLKWWTIQISKLLWIISDMTNFVNESNDYDPAQHFGATLSLERIFVTAVEIFRLKTKDEVLRKILLFDLLDLLDGNGLGNYVQNLSYDTQHDAWLLLKANLDEPIARSLSLIIENGFEALKNLGDDFWTTTNRGVDGSLAIERKDGHGVDTISLDRARGDFLRILRNSHHGFKKIAGKDRDLSFLASHTGALDNKLADLAWWFMIRLLSDPDVLLPFSHRRAR